MSVPSYRHMVDRLLEEERPLRFLAARVLWRTGLCRLITFSMPEGYRMRFHPSAISAALWQDRGFRDEDADICRRLLRPGDTYVDVGANIGQLTVLAARRVGRGGTVLAIEAHPRTYRFLKENCSLNGLSWVDARNTAVGDEDGTVSFTDLSCDDQNFVDPASGASRREVVVPVTCLDEIAPARAIRLMKVDVEGFELRVLAGGKATMARSECLYIEESRRNLARYHETPERLRGELVRAGFGIFSLRDGDLVEDETAVEGDGSRNLLAVRPESMADIRECLRRPTTSAETDSR